MVRVAEPWGVVASPSTNPCLPRVAKRFLSESLFLFCARSSKEVRDFCGPGELARSGGSTTAQAFRPLQALEVRGNVVKAFVVLAEGYQASEALTKGLQDHSKDTTAPYKYPRIIEYVKELPKTTSGEIMRRELREKP